MPILLQKWAKYNSHLSLIYMTNVTMQEAEIVGGKYRRTIWTQIVGFLGAAIAAREFGQKRSYLSQYPLYSDKKGLICRHSQEFGQFWSN
jgi:hypothetical protein